MGKGLAVVERIKLFGCGVNRGDWGCLGENKVFYMSFVGSNCDWALG